MFKLPEETELLVKKWPVVVSVPQDDGRIAKYEIRADYHLLSQEELDDLMEASRESGGSTDADMLRRVVRCLYDVQDAGGHAIEHSDDLLDRLINIPYVRIGLVNAYFTAAAGQKAKRKN